MVMVYIPHQIWVYSGDEMCSFWQFGLWTSHGVYPTESCILADYMLAIWGNYFHLRIYNLIYIKAGAEILQKEVGGLVLLDSKLICNLHTVIYIQIQNGHLCFWF